MKTTNYTDTKNRITNILIGENMNSKFYKLNPLINKTNSNTYYEAIRISDIQDNTVIFEKTLTIEKNGIGTFDDNVLELFEKEFMIIIETEESKFLMSKENIIITKWVETTNRELNDFGGYKIILSVIDTEPIKKLKQ